MWTFSSRFFQTEDMSATRPKNASARNEGTDGNSENEELANIAIYKTNTISVVRQFQSQGQSLSLNADKIIRIGKIRRVAEGGEDYGRS